MVRFAIMGCGRIGCMHAGNLAKHPDAELVAAFDVVPAVSAEIATSLGIKQAASVGEILEDKIIDAVLIATSTNTHVDLIIASARAGKAVLCEKPIDLDMARVTHCWEEIATLNPMVMIGFNRRFDPSFAALERRVRNGEIGRVEQVIISSRDPAPPPVSYIVTSGGLFRDMMIHDFDMARFIVGDIVEVTALGLSIVDPAIGAAGDIDSAMVTLRSASGALIHINNTRRCSYGYDQRLEVFGESGMLIAGNRRETSVEAWSGNQTQAADPVLHFFIQRYSEAYAAEISHLISCIQDGTTPQASYRDGVEALRIADAAEESLRTGRTVRLQQS